MSFFHKNKSKRKDYTRDVPVKPSLIPTDDLSNVATLLEFTSMDTRRMRPDKFTPSYQVQQLSVMDDKIQHYKIDLTSLKGRREYVSLSKMAMVFLGIFPKDTGAMTFRLRNDD